MACDTSASYTLNYPWVAPGVNEAPGTTRTFSEWTAVLLITGSELCEYMLDYPAWFTQSPAPGLVTSWAGRTGAVVPQAGDYDTSEIDPGAGTTIPGATLFDQLEWLKANGGGTASWLEVVSQIAGTPPGSPPPIGARLLVGAGATGLFAGQDQKIAVSDGVGGYVFQPTNEGDCVTVLGLAGLVLRKESGQFVAYRFGNFKVKASAADTTEAYLFDKLEIVGFTKSLNNPGGNEVVRFVDGGAGGGSGAFPVSVYRNVSTATTIPASGAWVDVIFETADMTNAAISRSGADFFVQTGFDGSYFIGADVTAATGSSRAQHEVRVMYRPSGGSYAEVQYFGSKAYSPSTGNDEQTVCVIPKPIVLAAGDSVKVQVRLSPGSDPASLSGKRTSIAIVKLESGVGSGGGGAAAWGSITGTLSSQLDLQAALNGKAPASHNHPSADITDASYGGNGALDADKVAKFYLEGQLRGNVENSAVPAIWGQSSGSGYSGYFNGGQGVGIPTVLIFNGGLGNALNARAASGYGADIESVGVAASFHAAYTGVGTPDIAEFATGLAGTVKLLVGFDGSLSWPAGGTGPSATRTNLGLGPAALENIATAATADRLVKTLGTGKIDTSFLPDSVLGQLEYQGTWDAATNTPAIPAASSANKGWYYIASSSVAAGHGYANIPNIAYDTGDWLVSNGSTWDKVDNTDAISSWNGRTGAVVPASGDYNAGQVAFTPTGGVASTTVQAAIAELDSEKAASSHTHAAAEISDGTTVGRALLTLSNPSAIRFLRINADNTVTARTAADILSDLSLGTAAQVNTGTGASDVPTITDADARYAKLYAPSFISYTGGNQNTTSTSFADIHSSAGWNSVAPGFYRFEARIAHNSAALTTGAAFVLNGTITQDYMNGAMFYSANTGDRGAYVMGGTLNAGQASTSSVASGTTMGATITGHINVTATGDIRIAFATEVAGSQIQVTNVVGFIQRIY